MCTEHFDLHTHHIVETMWRAILLDSARIECVRNIAQYAYGRIACIRVCKSKCDIAHIEYWAEHRELVYIYAYQNHSHIV